MPPSFSTEKENQHPNASGLRKKEKSQHLSGLAFRIKENQKDQRPSALEQAQESLANAVDYLERSNAAELLLALSSSWRYEVEGALNQ